LYFGQRTSNPPSRFIIDIPEELLEAVGGDYFENDLINQKSSFEEIDDIVNF
jgi:hypothetical protein